MASTAYSSTLKMEAVCSYETSVSFYQATRRYILYISYYIAKFSSKLFYHEKSCVCTSD
jgi:hypothetical protein